MGIGARGGGWGYINNRPDNALYLPYFHVALYFGTVGHSPGGPGLLKDCSGDRGLRWVSGWGYIYNRL